MDVSVRGCGLQSGPDDEPGTIDCGDLEAPCPGTAYSAPGTAIYTPTALTLTHQISFEQLARIVFQQPLEPVMGTVLGVLPREITNTDRDIA